MQQSNDEPAGLHGERPPPRSGGEGLTLANNELQIAQVNTRRFLPTFRGEAFSVDSSTTEPCDNDDGGEEDEDEEMEDNKGEEGGELGQGSRHTKSSFTTCRNPGGGESSKQGEEVRWIHFSVSVV